MPSKKYENIFELILISIQSIKKYSFIYINCDTEQNCKNWINYLINISKETMKLFRLSKRACPSCRTFSQFILFALQWL